MEKIKEPCWSFMIDTNRNHHGDLVADWSDVSIWFNEKLKDKYIVDESELVEVQGSDKEIFWYKKSFDNATHKAYLIGIEPIKKETVEDVVKDYLAMEDDLDEICGESAPNFRDIFNRLKAIAESK